MIHLRNIAEMWNGQSIPENGQEVTADQNNTFERVIGESWWSDTGEVQILTFSHQVVLQNCHAVQKASGYQRSEEPPEIPGYSWVVWNKQEDKEFISCTHIVVVLFETRSGDDVPCIGESSWYFLRAQSLCTHQFGQKPLPGPDSDDLYSVKSVKGRFPFLCHPSKGSPGKLSRILASRQKILISEKKDGVPFVPAAVMYMSLLRLAFLIAPTMGLMLSS